MVPSPDEYVPAAKRHLPLRIEQAEYNGAYFHTHGEDWSLLVWSSWRLSRDGVLVASPEFEPGRVSGVAGLHIVGADVQSRTGFDPAFELSDGSLLEVFSTGAEEPWVLRLPSPPTFVASPTSAEDAA